MNQLWLFPELEPVGLDAFLAITLAAYTPLLLEMIMRESAMSVFFREMFTAPKQIKLLDITRKHSHKKWFRTRSGKWAYAFLGLDNPHERA